MSNSVAEKPALERMSNSQFSHCTVYFSNSIRGGMDQDIEVAAKLVQFMKSCGAYVLSEHVVVKDTVERLNVHARQAGSPLMDQPEPWTDVRRTDTQWVDTATHIVAVVNTPSHGVGMEIERALLKPDRGLPPSPILCLVQQTQEDKLSWMIRGIDSPLFSLCCYSTVNEAQAILHRFLLGR
jgi:hypothetical protein